MAFKPRASSPAYRPGRANKETQKSACPEMWLCVCLFRFPCKPTFKRVSSQNHTISQFLTELKWPARGLRVCVLSGGLLPTPRRWSQATFPPRRSGMHRSLPGLRRSLSHTVDGGNVHCAPKKPWVFSHKVGWN